MKIRNVTGVMEKRKILAGQSGIVREGFSKLVDRAARWLSDG